MADEKQPQKPTGRRGAIQTLIRWQQRLSGKRIGPFELISAILVSGLGLGLLQIGSLIALNYDSHFLGYRPNIPSDTVIVYLDDESHRRLDQPFTEAWDRGFHARLVERMTEAGARLVLFDILFAGASKYPEADEEFATAIRENGRVIISGQIDGREKFLTTSYEPLLTNALSWALVNYVHDPDFTIRNHLGAMDWQVNNIAGDTNSPRVNMTRRTLSWEAAHQLTIALPPKELGDARHIGIHYYGPPDSIPSVPFWKVDEEVEPLSTFTNKIVLVGAKQSAGFSGAGKDTFGTTYTKWTEGEPHAAGVEIHATKLLNLIHQDYLTRLPRWVEYLLFVLIGIGVSVGLLQFRPRFAIIVSLVSAIVIVSAGYGAFHLAQYWFPWMVALSQLAAALVIAIAVFALRYYVQAQVLEGSLAFHVSPKRAKQLRERPELLEPHGEHSPVSFFFSDIEGFTTVSDRIDPNTLFANLNKYFDVAMPCFYETDGTVMQFVGDAIYAIWNAPEPQDDHAARTIRTALMFRDKLAELRARDEPYAFKTRIGLHSGYANVGNCGSNERFEYAAIGKDTNMAARLEGLNKYLGTEIIGSEALVNQTGDEFLTRPLGRFQLKGSDRIVAVHEVLGARNGAPEPEWLKPFADGLAAFRKRAWDDAESQFQSVLEMRDQLDGPSRFYLNQTRRLRDVPPGQVWMGEVIMDEK